MISSAGTPAFCIEFLVDLVCRQRLSLACSPAPSNTTASKIIELVLLVIFQFL